MSDDKDSGDQVHRTPDSDTPLTEEQCEMIDQFLEIREAYRLIVKHMENSLQTSLNHYQEQRLFYHDISDLGHFRRSYFTTVGYFLQESIETSYRLEIWDRHSHRKLSFTLDELEQADECEVKKGTAVETLNYGKFGYRLRRTFEIRHHHLYWLKTQFYIAGKPVPLVDGLMMLERDLEEHTLWLKGSILHIKDFT
ncbi:hypothetical protein FD13_GL000284 [Levilactobacillus senmaizukei DSM 21775 = NBRC 103853]|uniref:Uncharacterized protein n=1 Tax=Levilactobacillus senmaizukei DSM 21775 = NBRC 103853 TaxID=1423803 RepID=A0A0R2DDM3_9LACO|nr:hypothetical protein [Levilactobacillus senmaizukei]KRN02144.1 hypothetical protein FD13_GL000284 [Levilactobacillus senmaizukei DSM 21775 = NBRC 103853]